MGKMLVIVCLLVLFLNVGFIHSGELGHLCPNNTRYDSNSSSGRIYKANLDLLLSVLTSNASRPNGFYSFSTGGATDLTNDTTIYGLFLCRGDVGTSDCRTCVETAAKQILRFCPVLKVATLWYDNCMLRYSNQSILSTVEGGSLIMLKNINNVTNQDLFDRVLLDNLNQVAIKAAFDVSGKKFSVGEKKVAGSHTIYALGQCTPDLSSSDCRTCLGSVLQSMPRSAVGARILVPSCNLRYETYPFYSVSAPATSKGSLFKTGAIVAIVLVPVFVIIVVVIVYIVMKKSKPRDEMVETTGEIDITASAEFLKYKFSEIRNWTNNFAEGCKVGGGGFGNVYKGTLPNGREIAVKRLFRGSAQGTKEFVNEITLLAKLQHRNLVQLLGYCLKDDEKMLVYEFLPKRSLDYFLFDPDKQSLLDWSTRYSIIGGIAKGLLYLHEESPLKIIHRDLKASNVLLDENMTPKIADFGLARIFEVDQSKGSTSKIAGTYGYMAPEYAMHGVISVKLDVYSFGVLVLEIITGNKSSSFLQSRINDDLLSYAWRQWRDGTPLALLDPSIKDSCNGNEVIQCIHIGLLCVQEDVEDRPTMASVVLMLNSYSVTLPIPKPPSFFRSS